MTQPVRPKFGVPKFGVIVLTMGNRPDDLRRGLASLLNQRDVDLDVVVVGNGWQPMGLPHGVKAKGLAENLGIPAGRNAGVSFVEGELLFFLDDDACLPADDILARMAAQFAADPTLGMIQPRVVDPQGLEAPRRWTPRVRVGDPGRSSAAMNVWEGAVAVRRDAFEFAGGWPEPFWYAHEGSSWRGGCGTAASMFTTTAKSRCITLLSSRRRHAEFYRFQARNRVWLARRNPPLPVGVIYVLDWTAVSAIRLRSRTAWRETLRGYHIGLSEPGGERRPMNWRTIWRMTRAGHPPII